MKVFSGGGGIHDNVWRPREYGASLGSDTLGDEHVVENYLADHVKRFLATDGGKH